MNNYQEKSKPPHPFSNYTKSTAKPLPENRCGDKEEAALLEELDALRDELAKLEEDQRILGLAFRTLENRFNALDTVLRHMLAAKLGHGPTVPTPKDDK
jgi:hypothetical protein